MNAMLEAALGYAHRGWPIFPCKPREKTPLTRNGVLDATTNIETITGWWTDTPEANIGLDCGGAGFMVLDFDPGSSLEELEKNVGSIPKTSLRARTPRGGEHQFFSLATDELVSPSSSKLAPHIDVRSFHSYVLLAPSKTKDGSYTWESDGKAAHRTDEMVRVANSAREKDKDRDTWVIDADQHDNIQRAVSWLSKESKIAVEGQGGDHCAYATAAYLKSLAISEDKCFDLLIEFWNPRCNPPWRPDEEDHLRQKVANAYAYNTSPPGNLTEGFRRAVMAKGFKAIALQASQQGDETIAGGFRFVSRAGMDSIADPEWIIEDCIPDEGYVILFGPRSSLKTFVALDMALSIASGFPLDPTWKVLKPGAVLFAAGEGRSALRQRVRGWETLHHGGNPVKDFVLVDPVPTTVVSEEALDAFVKEAMRRHPGGYRMVVIDTLGRAMEGADENSQRDAGAMTALVHRIRSELGGSVLVVAHSGAVNDRRPRGSTVFEADADTMLRAIRRGKELVVNLHMPKQKNAPEWEVPRKIKMVRVRAGDDATLAAAPAPQQTPEEREAEEAREESATAMTYELIERELKAILGANKLKAWKQSELAEALAHAEGISLGSGILNTRWLRDIWQGEHRKGSFAHRAYDPARSRLAGRWRWPN